MSGPEGRAQSQNVEGSTNDPLTFYQRLEECQMSMYYPFPEPWEDAERFYVEMSKTEPETNTCPCGEEIGGDEKFCDDCLDYAWGQLMYIRHFHVTIGNMTDEEFWDAIDDAYSWMIGDHASFHFYPPYLTDELVERRNRIARNLGFTAKEATEIIADVIERKNV